MKKIVKHQFPTNEEFFKLFKSVGWEREAERVSENRKASCFAVSVYLDDEIAGMARVVGDGVYFTVYDVVVDDKFQGMGIGSILMKEIVSWYKKFADDDTFLYVNSCRMREKFYEKFGFVSREKANLGAGMIFKENKN